MSEDTDDMECPEQCKCGKVFEMIEGQACAVCDGVHCVDCVPTEDSICETCRELGYE